MNLNAPIPFFIKLLNSSIFPGMQNNQARVPIKITMSFAPVVRIRISLEYIYLVPS